MRIQLPAFYYLDHFTEMLDNVGRTYAGMVDASHDDFIKTFRSLTRDAQCLYVRMTNRKGALFSLSSLLYSEIGDINAAADLLIRHGLARTTQVEDRRAMLLTLRKTELIDLAAHLICRSSASKAQLAEALLNDPATAKEALKLRPENYLVRLQGLLVDFLIYLYFGSTKSDLKSFTLRDLGVVDVGIKTGINARFETACEAKACFKYSLWRDVLSSGRWEDYEDIKNLILDSEVSLSAYAHSMRAKLAAKVGRFFEREEDLASATRLFNFSDNPEARERLVRIHHAQGFFPEARLLLEKMIDDPETDEEFVFAEDFYQRKFDGRKIGECTKLLRNSGSIDIDETHRNAPEPGAAAYFRREGWQAYETENLLWRCLFGLLFWSELFETPGIFASPFDRLPHCLKEKTFHSRHGPAIYDKLSAVRDSRGLSEVLKTVAAYRDRPNGLFAWRHVDIDALTALLARAPPAGLADMLQLMTEDFYGMNDGFPDLMLVNDKTLRFVEVKAEGDIIRRNQLTRMRQLQRSGISAEIFRVGYRYDPDQTYVVIDVETTGGFGNAHRITEVAAVKVRRHRVIDEWQSLINPERRIPAGITRLTGISDAMVSTAPLFREIANDLEAFTNDAIFVAHNVNFDYGFISSEYRRLDLVYNRPKFCTVANMRRHFPGLSSYSLGNLCQEYDIGLDQHHRALHDARATATLLSMINTKREKNECAVFPEKFTAEEGMNVTASNA